MSSCTLQAKDVDDLSFWKYLVSMQLETFLRENIVLRFLSYLTKFSLNVLNIIIYLISMLCTQGNNKNFWSSIQLNINFGHIFGQLEMLWNKYMICGLQIYTFLSFLTQLISILIM